MGEKTVGVPTVKGMGSAFKSFAVGAGGGLVFLLAYKLFGALGIIAAPLIAGSMIKGERGEMISTIAGFMLFAAVALGTGTSSNNSDDLGTM